MDIKMDIEHVSTGSGVKPAIQPVMCPSPGMTQLC